MPQDETSKISLVKIRTDRQHPGMELYFAVAIDPTAKGRPRFTKSGHAFTPAKTRAFEAEFSLRASKFKPKKPLEGPLHVEVGFAVKPPKKRKHPTYPIVKPDLDNYFKAIGDALNGIFWLDDSQIVSVKLTKYYAMDLNPRISVTIREL